MGLRFIPKTQKFTIFKAKMAKIGPKSAIFGSKSGF
jgi:hypothetical protein